MPTLKSLNCPNCPNCAAPLQVREHQAVTLGVYCRSSIKIQDADHFLQKEKGEEIARHMVEFIRRTPSSKSEHTCD